MKFRDGEKGSDSGVPMNRETLDQWLKTPLFSEEK